MRQLITAIGAFVALAIPGTGYGQVQGSYASMREVAESVRMNDTFVQFLGAYVDGARMALTLVGAAQGTAPSGLNCGEVSDVEIVRRQADHILGGSDSHFDERMPTAHAYDQFVATALFRFCGNARVIVRGE